MFSVSQLPKAPENARSSYTSLECFRDSWMCEAKTENNPLCGSFLPRFTGLSESWITGNQFQNYYKHSQKILPLLYEQSSGEWGSLSRVCTSQLQHILWHSACKSWTDFNICPMLKSTKLGSASLDREVGDCTREVSQGDMQNASWRCNQPYPVLQLRTSRDSDPYDLSTTVLRWLSHPQVTALITWKPFSVTASHPKPESPCIPFCVDRTGCGLQQLQAVKSAATAPESQRGSQIRILTSLTAQKKCTFQKWRTEMQPLTAQQNMASPHYIRIESKSDSQACTENI